MIRSFKKFLGISDLEMQLNDIIARKEAADAKLQEQIEKNAAQEKENNAVTKLLIDKVNELHSYKAVADDLREQLDSLSNKEKEESISPKEKATLRNEPWVAVINTHVNSSNIRNGFFELDWNAQFIQQLHQAGYGFPDDPEEEVVDRWFKELAHNMLTEEGLDPSRPAGYINIPPITKAAT